MTTQARQRARALADGVARTIVISVLGAVVGAGCHAAPDGQRSVHAVHPVVLIGLDGLEWSVVLRLLAAGQLPALGGLMDRGRYGTLTATKPTLSPIIWTSIATGVDSRTHGILGFVHGEQQQSHRADGRAAALYTSNDRRVKAFWNIASEAGCRVHTIGWWMTYPVETINGVMVAQVNTITPQMRRAGRGIWKGQLVPGVAHQVHPLEREAALLALVPEVEAELPELTKTIFGEIPANAPKLPATLLEQSSWAFRADALYAKVALAVLTGDGAFDLFAVYFGGADVVGHRFWRHAHPELYRHPPPPNETATFGHVLDAYYVYLDGVVADLLAAAPADANVIVVSDHGMSPVRRGDRFITPALSGGHLGAPPAFIVAAGPDIRDDSADAGGLARRDLPTLGSVLDVTPTVLALLGLPIGRDMQGDVMSELLAPALLERSPLRYVARLTEPGWFAARAKPSVDSTGSTERLEQLRSLGYLDE